MGNDNIEIGKYSEWVKYQELGDAQPRIAAAV
jgi:hypothetical protein